MSKLFGQKLLLKKILYIYSLQQTDALDSLAFTERTFCAIDALENFDYKPLFMFQVNLGSDLFFSEGTVWASASAQFETWETWQFLREQRTEVWESEGWMNNSEVWTKTASAVRCSIVVRTTCNVCVFGSFIMGISRSGIAAIYTHLWPKVFKSLSMFKKMSWTWRFILLFMVQC